MRLEILTALTIGVAAGCASVPAPLTQVRGDEVGLTALVGEWSGEYWTEGVADRAGSIYLRVSPGVDTARGQVIMVPQQQQQPIHVIGKDPWLAPALLNQHLSIRFVRAVGDSVRGMMDPYVDPYCGCELDTRFAGRIRGNRAQGTFISIHQDGQRTGGRWVATRTSVKQIARTDKAGHP